MVFGPLDLEDLKVEAMLEFLKKAEQFFIRFATDGKTGYVVHNHHGPSYPVPESLGISVSSRLHIPGA